MAYTTGSQSINKSMNGILNFDTGGGVIIEGDTITAGTMTATDIICNTLTVNSTSTFNGSVPTSTITGTPTLTQIAPVSMLDAIHGRLTTAFTNTWLSTNIFNAILPTSTLTGTPTGTQIAPVNMLNNLYLAAVAGGYARLTTVDNTFTNNNTFKGSTGIAVDNAITAGGQVSGNSLYSSNGITAGANILCVEVHATSGVYFELNDRMYAKAALGRLQFINIATSARSMSFELGTAIPFLIEPTQITHSVKSICSAGADFTTADTISITQQLGTSTTFVPVFKLTNQQTIPSIIFMLLNAIAGSANSCVLTGDAVIYSNPTPLVLTTANAGGTGIRITATDVAFTGTTTTLNAAQTIVKSPQTASSSNVAFAVINSVVSPNNNTINMACNLSVGNYNGIVATGDSAIFSGGAVGTSNLVLTTHSNTPVGVRITPTTTTISGTSTTLASATTIFSGTATFNTNLPTSILTGTPTATQIAPVAMLNNLYSALVSGGYARLTSGNDFTSTNLFSAFCPSSSVDATAVDVTNLVNWRTLLVQIAAAWTTNKGSINTWTASNTFNLNISTLLPINFTWASAQTYAAGSVGYTLNNQTRLLTTTSGTANTYSNPATINFPAQYGVFLIEYTILLNAPIGTYTIGIGPLSPGPLTSATQVSQITSAQSAYSLKCVAVYQNTSLNQIFYGSVKSTIASVPITSVDIRYTRIG